jgi:hypothetical protein
MNNTNKTNIKTGVYFYGDDSFDFEFATSLTVSEKITFVNSVTNTVVADNYNSLVRDLMFDYMIIKVFTDVDATFINNFEDKVDIIEKFLEETNIVDIVKANMEIGLLESLNEAVDKAIEYRTGIHPSPINDALASLLSTLERKVEEIDLGSAMSMAQKFAGMTDELTLDALVNAYMNSETHKNNLIEIEKAKKDEKTKKSKKNEIKIDENLGEAIRTVIKENKAENDGKNDKN